MAMHSHTRATSDVSFLTSGACRDERLAMLTELNWRGTGRLRRPLSCATSSQSSPPSPLSFPSSKSSLGTVTPARLSSIVSLNPRLMPSWLRLEKPPAESAARSRKLELPRGGLRRRARAIGSTPGAPGGISASLKPLYGFETISSSLTRLRLRCGGGRMRTGPAVPGLGKRDPVAAAPKPPASIASRSASSGPASTSRPPYADVALASPPPPAAAAPSASPVAAMTRASKRPLTPLLLRMGLSAPRPERLPGLRPAVAWLFGPAGAAAPVAAVGAAATAWDACALLPGAVICASATLRAAPMVRGPYTAPQNACLQQDMRRTHQPHILTLLLHVHASRPLCTTVAALPAFASTISTSTMHGQNPKNSKSYRMTAGGAHAFVKDASRNRRMDSNRCHTHTMYHVLSCKECT
eukprot:100385-Chlamydomonas_euryale.AAC.15